MAAQPSSSVPELPEVEAVCALARRALRGRRITALHIYRRRISEPQRPAAVQRVAANRRVLDLCRRGKFIEIQLDGATIHVHLRMTGNLYPLAHAGMRPATASACFQLDNGRALVFDDPRGLGVLRLGAAPPTGLDPLTPAFSLERFLALARAARGSVKAWLLDQRRIGGLGNIYAAEALFAAGIDPRRAPASLRRSRLARLHAAIVRILTDAVQSASLAYQRPGGCSEGERFDPAVYGREGLPCLRCRGPIRRLAQGGRSTYFCPRCQS
jgi:formamidopyrimidine-DNA glycosylase